MTHILTDQIDPARATAMQAMLGDARVFGQGDALPPFYHQLYFWDPQPPTRLGRDGHPTTGTGLIPDMGLPRRMWAGGSLRFHAPILAGIRAEKRSAVESSTRKDGRSGPLAFVRLRHDYWQRGSICLTEWQDLVYREDPGPDAAPVAPPQARVDEAVSEVRSFDETALFRYSALTFNGHRIHYDVDYARAVEGYAGLVVHGPLLAQMLMLLAEAQLGGLTEFTYRATSPLIAGERGAFCWADGALWVRGADGRQCMEAVAR